MPMMEKRLLRYSLYFRHRRHIPLTFELLKENFKLRFYGIWSENGLESTEKSSTKQKKILRINAIVNNTQESKLTIGVTHRSTI